MSSSQVQIYCISSKEFKDFFTLILYFAMDILLDYVVWLLWMHLLEYPDLL